MVRDNKPHVRFAPSPTGYLHIGGLRTALYNFLFAKKNGGDFLLRIEDTDQKRQVEGALENLLKTLKWAGISWDEELVKQSERLAIYKRYAEELVKKGQAYYCFCEPERLEKMRKTQAAQKQPPIYDRYCLRNISPEEINKNLKSNCPFVIRLKVPENETIEFNDLIRGKVKFNTDLIDDQVLLKSDGYPTYHLANVVDDHEMKITHVIRGEEWLSSTPKHTLLYRYFGWEEPKFAHLPLLLNPNKTKLSKRQDDVSVEDYIAKGYLKEAVINFVAMLGWNPGEGSTQEIFTLEELIEKFNLSHVHKGGAVFDIKKLDWINSQWIKKLSSDDLYNLAIKFLEQKEFYRNAPESKKTPEFIKKVLAIEQERLTKLSEVGESNKFFFEDINYDKALLKWKNMSDEELKMSLQKSEEIIKNIIKENWTQKKLEKELINAAGDKKGELLWPLRVALTGEQKSPSPFECAWVLGKEETLKRIKKAVDKLIKIKSFSISAIIFSFSFLVLSLFFASFVKAADCEDECSVYTDEDKKNDCEDKCKKLDKQAKIYENILKLNDKQQDNLSNQLDYIDQQQGKNQQDLQGAIDKVNDLSLKISALERNIAEKEKSINYQKKILTGLMQSYYEYDQQGLLKIILLDQNLSDSLSSSDYIEQSGVKVTEMLADIQKNREELIKNREELKQDYEESAKLKDELQYTKSNLQLTENQKQSLLLQTQGQEEKYKDLLAHIEEQKRELFNFSEASNLQEVFDSLKSYPKPDKKYWASTAWYFSQRDSRWDDQRIGNSKSLMKDYGCAVASVSMVFRKFGSATDPGKMAKEKIFYYDLIKWPSSWSSGIKLVSSVSHGNVNWTKIKSEIGDGNPVIVYIKKTNGRGGHYVVITGYDKDEKKYVVHDPYFGSNLYLNTSQGLIGKLGADSKTVIDQMIIYND